MCKFLIFKQFFNEESKQQTDDSVLSDPEYAFDTMIKLMSKNKVSNHPALLCIDNAEGLI